MARVKAKIAELTLTIDSEGATQFDELRQTIHTPLRLRRIGAVLRTNMQGS